MNNQATASWPKDKTIVDLFMDQVAKTPDKDAVSFGETSYTYQILDQKSNQLAHFLKKSGIKENDLIPICLDRSLNMIVGILGILKAGGVYVPIDPDYPEDRIQYMLQDSKGAIVVTDNIAAKRIGKFTGALVNLDSDQELILKEPINKGPEIQIRPNDLAYIIYTSGSTGRPKGVMIEHANVVRLFFTEFPLFDFDQNDVWTMFHSFCFDFSVWEMYGALFYGGKLVVVPKEIARDNSLFANLLVKEHVTVLNQTPSALYALQEFVVGNSLKLAVRYVIFGGEALNPSKIKPWKELFDKCRLINMYGITETTVHVTYKELELEHLNSNSSVIGKPIPTLSAFILDSNQQEVAPGELGELYIGGAGLARGYLNMPQLTSERFIHNPFDKSDPNSRLYRTGDLAKLLPDGSFEYFGRIDEQVKIRGFRIELGEIESVILQFPGIKNCVVVAKEDKDGDKRLVAYLVLEGEFKKDALLKWVSSRLPDYMVPRQLIPLDKIPLTSNGKTDKKALPDPDASELIDTVYVAPRNKTEEKLVKIWSDVLGVKKVGVNDNFFELGGNSLRALKVVANLKQQHHIDLPVIKIYQFPSVSSLAAHLDGNVKSPKKLVKKNNSQSSAHSDIAVIGMSGRFPGANTIDELWDLLRLGKESIRFFKKEELDPYIGTNIINDPDYVPARGIIKGAEKFDASFFGITPKLASLMDPQQRIFLEIAWEALESSGYIPQKFDGAIGVFAGTYNNTYYLNNVLGHREMMDAAGDFQVMTLNEKDFIATRTAYELDLKGPALSLYSACSTSLLAIAQAVESLRKGQCDIALAGGASITVPINSGHIYQEGAMLSRDGHCRSFDKDAGGTVFSDGAGVVLLKKKEDAERDGDTIYAVIKGVGLNNDGGGKGSFTAPSAEGQAGAISMAIEDSGISPATITYVEAHGTATPIGDPIEIEGLKIAFGTQQQNQYCAIGSIKSNMGHLTAAAGVAGFIKTVLSLHHKKLLPSINFTNANPNIDFINSPFIVNTEFKDWNAVGVRRAGVSAFGVGGTNVHVVLEEFENPQKETTGSRPVQLINWSAKTLNSREAYAKKLTGYLHENPQAGLADMAYTLQTARKDFNARRFLVASNKDELLEKLNAPSILPTESLELKESFDQVVFSFPGQGSQYVNMGIDLYKNEIVFKEAVDKCAGILQKILKLDIRDIIYPKINGAEADENINNTFYTQPAIFVIEYATAKLWMSWGIKPSAFIGHSIGEFVAAHLAGVFSLEDGLNLIATRGKMMSELPRGSMLAVRAEYDQIKSLLSPDLSLAVVNSPGSSVIAGPQTSIDELSKKLSAANISSKQLATSHAFHSSMMDPIVAPFEGVVKSVKLSLPLVPIVSTVTGQWMTDAEATNPAYWAGHLRSTVRFADAVKTLFENDRWLVLETGPKNVTASLIRQQTKKGTVAISSLDQVEGQSEYYSILKALGQLWLYAVPIDWAAFYANEKRARLQIPTYAFDQKVLWVDPVTKNQQTQTIVATNHQQIDFLPTENNIDNPTQNNSMRKDVLIKKIKEVLENASGIEMESVTTDMNFIEMGFDSLLLTQVALNLKKEFKLPITFRQLNEEYSTLDALSSFLDANLPQETFKQSPSQASQVVSQPINMNMPTSPVVNDSAIGLISQQILLLSQQIALMQGNSWAAANIAPQPVAVAVPPKKNAEAEVTAEELVELKKPFGATAKIERSSTELSPKQKAFVENLSKRYIAKTKASKDYTQQHRPYTADPRVVTGFRPATKELVYSIVANKSKGCHIWDLDGNEYVDALNGFGSNFFGYQPDFIVNAIKAQMDKGYEIGPQHELAGPVSKLICEFTGFDRVGLCNTGSEAVLGAMRIARTVTGRSIIVAFTGSYHGIVDEVIVRGTKKLKSFPAAPGIMPEAVQNMLILDYGTEESLRIIRERADEIAAVLVEPVQSRRPEFQPVEFLKELRKITEASGTVLVFDEVITGFRMHPGGAQALFGIKADIGTYGKVVGAGISIGVIAGKKYLMDALDGGYWQYGDNSIPEVGVTYFAGTFVRHPLALAAAKASLEYMKEKGPALQQNINDKSKKLADALNAICSKNNLPFFIAQFGSLWKIKFKEEIPYSELLFVLMREKGIHILDGFPCFMTEAHTDQDINLIISKFEESVNEMLEAGFFSSSSHSKENGQSVTKNTSIIEPPIEGAKLGKDKDGNPAWFITDPARPGKYLQVK